jgi:hypothetical protein
VGAWAPHRSEDAIARAARRLGIEARCFDILRRTRQFGPVAPPVLAHQIACFDPDFILCTRHAWHLGLPRLRTLLRGRRSAFWFFDAIEHEGVVALGQACDAMYTTYAAQRPLWRERGVPVVRFLPQALDPDLERPAEVLRDDDRCDASFIGSGQYPHRWRLLQAVAHAVHLKVWGPYWAGAPSDIPVVGGKIVGERFAQVVGASIVSLGANAVPEQDVEVASASDRMWKILACGGAYVGPYVPGIESLAADGEHCRWYRRTDECVAIVRELVAHPERARAMAERGRAHALAHHTYDERLKLLLADQEMPLPTSV